MEEEVIPLVMTEEQPDNLISQLREKRRAVEETKEVFLPIQGYDASPPKLLARYRLLSGPEINVIGEKVRRTIKGRWERQITAAVDFMIAACTGMFVDLEDGNGPIPLTFNGGEVTGFTEDLAQVLGFETDGTARSVVFGVFGKNELSISTHNIQLNRWMSDTSLDVTQDLLSGNF